MGSKIWLKVDNDTLIFDAQMTCRCLVTNTDLNTRLYLQCLSMTGDPIWNPELLIAGLFYELKFGIEQVSDSFCIYNERQFSGNTKTETRKYLDLK